MGISILKNAKKVHFIGIGGIGVSAIVRMFLLEGKKVSGSDVSPGEITDELEKQGAKIFIGQKAENLDPADSSGEKIDLVVYTVAIKENNLEFAEAKRQGIAMLSYPQVLGIISADKFTIAIAGTHGKTTTTGMIAKIMMDAGLDPTVIIGSLLKNDEKKPSNFIAGKSKYLVVEACEYRRSFLEINPRVAVITNIDNDHLDYYKDLSGVQKGFREFAEKLPAKEGALVCNVLGENMEPVLNDLSCTILNYESVTEDKVPKLKIPGEHNRKNAKAALVVASILGIPEPEAAKSLADFVGTWRRFEFLGITKNGTEVYDDYGHHPTEIKATLKGAREKFSSGGTPKKITVVFQPHLYSRTREHLDEFAHSFENADEVIIAPIYAAREPVDPEISSEILAAKLLAAGKKASAMTVDKSKMELSLGSTDELFMQSAELLSNRLGPNDVLITMGAGDINKLAIEALR